MPMVTVERIVHDPLNQGFAVILKDEGAPRLLPIYVGPFEAQAIMFELEKVSVPRPLTHDLLKNVVGLLNAEVLRVEVSSLQEKTFYAVITLQQAGEIKEIDARPSDAIALALRAQAPIFVAEEVMEAAGLPEDRADTPQGMMEALAGLADQIAPAAPPALPPAPEESEELRHLKADLQAAVEKEQYEEAARLRDQISELTRRQNSEPKA